MEHELYAKIGVSKIDIGGVGVIALKKIPKGTYPFQRKNPLKGHWVQEEDLPKNLEERQHVLGFCPLVSKANGKKWSFIPKNGFNAKDISFYMNHCENPNLTEGFALNQDLNGFQDFVAVRDIEKGEELCINYNSYKSN
jgi:SET domain-containing protein